MDMESAVHHPVGRWPVYDPAWLRALHTTCLWDGGVRLEGSEFCSERCETHYTEWEETVASQVLGREPLATELGVDQRHPEPE